MKTLSQRGSTATKVILIAMAVVIIGFIGMACLSFLFPISPGFVPALFSKFKLGNMQDIKFFSSDKKSSSYYKAKTPKPITGLTVSKTIAAKDGGEVKLTDPAGVEVSLVVFPNSLEQDTAIKISPLEEVPIQNYGPVINSGVLIEPANMRFLTPAVLTFNFKPEKDTVGSMGALGESISGAMNSGTSSLKSSPVTPKSARQKKESAPPLPPLAPLPGGTPELPPLAPLTPPSGSAGNNSGFGGIIHSDGDSGETGAVPGSTPPDGSSATGPIDGGGSYSPDNIDSDEAGNFMGQGGVGSCDQGQLGLLLNAMSFDQQNEITGNEARYRQLLKDCADEAIADLEKKCRENKIALRRKNFLLLISLLETWVKDNDKAEKVRKLLSECTAKYELDYEEALARNGGYMDNKIKGSVCGYIDDEWTGSDAFDITVPGTPAHEWWTGTFSMMLPPNGGSTRTTENGVMHAQLPSSVMTIPLNGIHASTVSFDGQKTIMVYGLGSALVPATIKMVSAPCSK